MKVNAKFLSNEYETDMIVVNGSDEAKNSAV
jgi:hypothetical protein